MATRGFENVSADDLARLGAGKLVALKKPAKYRNLRCEAPDGQRFDSVRECEYYLQLKARERAGEIAGLRRQVRYWLMAPAPSRHSYNVVSYYIADFVYQDAAGVTHVVDAKGLRTQVYLLKKKWLELQDGVVIEEV
jgi:hypothetical protein